VAETFSRITGALRSTLPQRSHPYFHALGVATQRPWTTGVTTGSIISVVMQASARGPVRIPSGASERPFGSSARALRTRGALQANTRPRAGAYRKLSGPLARMSGPCHHVAISSTDHHSRCRLSMRDGQGLEESRRVFGRPRARSSRPRWCRRPRCVEWIIPYHSRQCASLPS
jgi:hypothetical protein